jgi:ATP-dependent Clp protease ATP-binding subunit ClpC
MATEIVFPVGVLHRKLGPGAVLAEPLFVPEVARIAGSRDRAMAATAKSLRQFLGESKPETLIRRRRATAARELVFTLSLDPPRANASWREPVELTFHAAVWDEAGYVLARVPALGIEVIAGPKDDLTDRGARGAATAERVGELAQSGRDANDDGVPHRMDGRDGSPVLAEGTGRTGRTGR